MPPAPTRTLLVTKGHPFAHDAFLAMWRTRSAAAARTSLDSSRFSIQGWLPILKGHEGHVTAVQRRTSDDDPAQQSRQFRRSAFSGDMRS